MSGIHHIYSYIFDIRVYILKKLKKKRFFQVYKTCSWVYSKHRFAVVFLKNSKIYYLNAVCRIAQTKKRPNDFQWLLSRNSWDRFVGPNGHTTRKFTKKLEEFQELRLRPHWWKLWVSSKIGPFFLFSLKFRKSFHFFICLLLKKS